MDLTNLEIYFPGSGGDECYNTENLNVLAAYRPDKFPSYGEPFFNGRSTFRAIINGDGHDHFVRTSLKQEETMSLQ